MNRLTIPIIVLLAFTLVACAGTSIVGNQDVQLELDQLAAKAAAGTLVELDLETITALTEGDHDAEHHLEELTAMVRFNEQKHAGHAIAFLSAYVQNGQHIICPGHDLAHYYVFSRHGDEHEAEHALEHAEENLEKWRELAAAYDAKYPGPEPFADVDARVTMHLQQAMVGGATETSEEEIDWLATQSLCVPED